MKRKGISPLIAAVLLIAFTMAVASLFAQWAPGLMEEAQGQTKNQSGEIQRCSGVIVDVVDGNASHVTVQQKGGDSSVGNMSITWFYSDGTSPKQKYLSIGTTRGSGNTNISDPSSVSSGSLDFIRVNPLDCEGAPVAEYDGDN